MTTSRRALLLACATTLAAYQYRCHAFSSRSFQSPSTRASDERVSSPQGEIFFERTDAISRNCFSLFGKGSDFDDDRSRPKIVVIKTHDEYVKFLEEDDRLCIVKFYAHWCKSCQKFGMKYRHLASEEGDHINIEGDVVRAGDVRFAEVEYTAAAKLCKSLKVKKLPTVHMHRRGKGRVADMTCKPSLFHLVEDELRSLMEGGAPAAPETASAPEIRLEETADRKNGGNVTSTSFDGLAQDIMKSLREKEDAPDTKNDKKTWFFTQ